MPQTVNLYKLHQVALMTIRGLPIKEIAEKLEIAEITVSRYRNSSLCKQKISELCEKVFQEASTELIESIPVVNRKLLEIISDPDVPRKTQLQACELFYSQVKFVVEFGLNSKVESIEDLLRDLRDENGSAITTTAKEINLES